MFQVENWRGNEKESLVTDFTAEKREFEKNAGRNLKKVYKFSLPVNCRKSGFLYTPVGICQVVDYSFVYSGEPGKLLCSNVSDTILSSDEMRQRLASNDDFMQIILNLNKEQGGICIEEAKWILVPEKDSTGWFCLLIKVIDNISLHHVSNFLLFYFPLYAGEETNIHFMRIEDSSFELLKGMLGTVLSKGGM